MVKNISNPINARRVAEILAEDATRQQLDLDERKISVFLSDHRLSDFSAALKQLRQESILPEDFNLSDEGLSKLKSEKFILEEAEIKKSQIEGSELLDILESPQVNSIEFQRQLESLKDKLLKSWSGGISIDGEEYENFDRKFARPMKYFMEYMEEQQNKTISQLQAFAVVYATDYLTLGDYSKEDAYELMFGRFDDIKSQLDEEFGFKYNWGSPSGTTFITIGKKYSVSTELAEFARRFRGISGLDTYSDEVLQVFFLELLTGQLMQDMLEKKLIYRWNNNSDTDLSPEEFLLPPPEFVIESSLRSFLTQVVITHTMMKHFVQPSPSLLTLFRETSEMKYAERSVYLAKKLEATMTRKAVALQFGTTLANFMENFKTNPSKLESFLDLTYRYYTKSETIEALFSTIEHSIRTGLKNSTGLTKQYLEDISDDQLFETVKFNLMQSIRNAIISKLGSHQDEIILKQRMQLDKLNKILENSASDEVKEFFRILFDSVFENVKQFAKSLEIKKEAPLSKKGGLTELTHDFISTAFYHGSKNPASGELIDELINRGMEKYLAELIVKITSYITYQIASKEGKEGELMHHDLINHFEHKSYQMMSIPLNDGSTLGEHTESLQIFLIHELRQTHALVSLSSKLKTDAYNAWTPIENIIGKHALYLTDFILPNLIYWQRLPRLLVKDLLSSNLISEDQIGLIVDKTNRKSMLEAYILLILGHKNKKNTFKAAKNYLKTLFKIENDLDKAFQLNTKSGEAEITLEAIFLWNSLEEEK